MKTRFFRWRLKWKLVNQRKMLENSFWFKTGHCKPVKMEVGPSDNLIRSKAITKSLVFLLLFTLVCIHVSADENCLEIVKSVKEVESCPTTKEENDRAASLKNCGKITLGKTCNFTRVYYHCVINGYRNKTLEVCAPSRLIVGGHCAEFNVAGRRIQVHSLLHCNKRFPKCDAVYNSTDAYKYLSIFPMMQAVLIPRRHWQFSLLICSSCPMCWRNIFLFSGDILRL